MNDYRPLPLSETAKNGAASLFAIAAVLVVVLVGVAVLTWAWRTVA